MVASGLAEACSEARSSFRVPGQSLVQRTNSRSNRSPEMSRRLLCLTTALALLSGASVAAAQQHSVEAECGSVGIGGASIGNTVRIANVVCGIPPEQLEALIREKTRDLQDLSDTRRQLISSLQKELDL